MPSAVKNRIITGAILLLCASFVAGESQSIITGRIVDSEGAAIAGARVLVHWDSAGSTVGLSDNIGIQQDLEVTTDTSGTYSAKVPAGFYDVFVSATAFTPTAAKVRVKQAQRTTYNSALKPDPLVSRELAH
jgi:hypothetical protein